MKRNLLPLVGLLFLCAIFFVAAGGLLLFKALPLSDLPSIPAFRLL